MSECGEYELQVLFRTIESGKLTNINNFVDLSSKISSSGGYKFCPGLSTVLYKEKYFDILHKDSKSVKITASTAVSVHYSS